MIVNFEIGDMVQRIGSDNGDVENGEILKISGVGEDSLCLEGKKASCSRDNFVLIKKYNRGGKVMEYFKDYFNKHKDTFVTLGIVILIDEYLLGGSLREKVKSLVERILQQTEKKLVKEGK